MGVTPPPEPPRRIVTPRKPKTTHRPIIAVTDTELLVERSGLILPAGELPAVLLTEPSSIIACQGFGVHIELLIKTFGADTTFDSKGEGVFQYRVTPRDTMARNNNGEIHPTRITDAVVNFLGFKNAEKNAKGGKRWTRYHYPIDPVHFVRQSIDELYPGDEARIYKLLRFATEVREWCNLNLLEVKPSAGGLAAQLLRDPRFYPNPRRKVPGLVNGFARPRLPGNYYDLHARPAPEQYAAAYIDMSNAHHECAKDLEFPDANSLHAFGRWAEPSPEPFALLRRGVPPCLLLARPGLFHVRIAMDSRPPVHLFPPPYLRNPGVRDVWVYSNELELIEELGGRIIGIHAAFVASEAETGLNAYARFALAQIARHPTWKPWLKPTLHATYGILAAHPQEFETGFYRARGGVPTEYPLGRVWIPAKAHHSKHAVESRTANVIHRGMIEAEVRMRVLGLARNLTADGYRVLSVYADSLFIVAEQVPILPHPWRIAEQCTNLRFYTPTHWVSDQAARMPGIPKTKTEAERVSRLVRRELLAGAIRNGRGMLSGHNNRPKEGHHAARQKAGPAGPAGPA